MNCINVVPFDKIADNTCHMVSTAGIPGSKYFFP